MQGAREDAEVEVALQYNNGYLDNDLHLRQQHQHPRGRHAPRRVQDRADPDDQRLRAQAAACSRRRTRTSPARTSARG